MSRPHSEAHRIEVEWVDSSLNGEWRQHREVMRTRRKAVRCLSVGLLIAKDKHGITLASSAHGNELAGTMSIPKGAIRKVRRLR
jgi:hypothetical protein